MTTVRLTRSHMSTLQRCRRKFFYTYKLELEGSAAGGVMAEGILIHAALAAAYKATLTPGGFPPVVEGMQAMSQMLERGTYWYHGEEYVLGGIKPYEKEFVNRLGDAFQFYMEQTFPKAFADGWSVFAVEQDFEYEFAPGVIVEGTIDLIMQKGNIFTVWDHKTVSNVSTALQFLKLDTQMFAYEIMANDIIKKLHPGAQQVEMLYNIIRRDRPPGFGSRELRRNKDGSVSKQNASQDPADYLRQHRFHHNEVELHHASREFFNLVTEIEARLANDTDAEDQFSTRTPIKSGGEACLTSCSYFERCAAEMVGHRSPTFVPAQVEGDTD